MFVGDLVKTDIVGARRMGMTTVLKQPWGTARSHRMADFVIRQMSDLLAVLDCLQPQAILSNLDNPLEDARVPVVSA